MKPSRWCPHCAQPIEAFLVNSPSGEEVELERCTSCGGFWGQRGVIQDHFGPNAQYQLVGGMTERHCVECRILMTPAKLPAGIDVEVCPACRSMFLDAEELAQVGVRTPSRAPKRPGLPRPAGAARAVAAPTRAAQARPLPPPLPTDRSAAVPKAAEPVAEEEAAPIDAPGTFECVVCRKRKAVREGQALRDGLACRSCMKARAEGGEDEDLGLRNLLFGQPKKKS